MADSQVGDPVALLELVEPTRWQRLQDHFAIVLGIPLRTISPTRELLVNPSWPQGLVVDRAIRLLTIGEELDELVPPQAPPQEPTTLVTPLGLTYAVVPIKVIAEQVIAHFILGPMLVGSREGELEFHKRVNAMGQDAQALWPILLSLKLYSFTGIRSVMNLIEEVGSSLVRYAYQSNQLATILPSPGKASHAVAAYYTDRMVHSLLDASILATKAEGGSVMLYDAVIEGYRIAAAQGLPQEVVRTTRVRPGEGLAGLAVKRGQILLVDDRVDDPELKALMHQPTITSSLVAPLPSDGASQPPGILNLRTSNPDARFPAESVELLRKLTQLAQTAFASLSLLAASSQSPK